MIKASRIFACCLIGMLLLGLSAQAGIGMAINKAVPEDSTKAQAAAEPKENSIVDEVIWVVGNEPILKSDVEALRLQAEAEGVRFEGNPDYSIPEEIAVQKLFLHQAALDSIEVKESEVSQGVEQQINRWIQIAGSKEKLEEWRGQTVAQMRSQMHDDFRNQQLVQKMRQKLVEDVTVTPGDVRKYFKDLPGDSLPYVPVAVEVEIITRNPKISQEETNRVKDQLREFTDRVTKGETTFSTLARLYSEDPGSAVQGGEMDYVSRAELDPAFAAVAFNLTDPKKISKIVETEFGYHIIQLIDKRGEKIKVRHILLKPKVSDTELKEAEHMLDSLKGEIKEGKFTFEQAAIVSDDKDTRSNHGLMAYSDYENHTITSKFQMKDLPREVAREVEGMQPGDISAPFEMVNAKGKTVAAIVKLKSRTPAHRATITEDYQVMKNVVIAKERENIIKDWIANKIKDTYIWMKPRYRDGQYKYQGWVK